MRLLLDAGLPYLTGALLRERGHDVLHANDLGLGVADEVIMAAAEREGRVIITLDADFHAILAERRATKPSVVRIREQSLRHEAAAGLIEKILAACGEELEKGVMVSATQRRVRIRRLPVK